ncbi:hypothetical protein B0H17DRAFT_1148079 [Mycena rosella]|uniref:Uncharacterized protein n=1 Tax=Mycena rosella TaxID=1033263 RepID=A0AAD7FXH0_MYCRO|nr:hypothetical protein B0H17DRAFT_1148079 [Mycena rosella]
MFLIMSTSLQFPRISQQCSARITRRVEGPRGSAKICGHALMFDEIAIDPKVDYMSAIDEMAGKDTKTVDAAVAAVNDGKVHVAHEAMWVRSRISRGMTMEPNQCLSPLVARREVGEDNIVMDMDYRHEFKTYMHASVFCPGDAVKNVCVNRDLWSDGLNASQTTIGQSTVSKICCTLPIRKMFLGRSAPSLHVEIRTIDKTGLDPTEEAEYEALCLLGGCSKPCFNQRHSFMSNQLYGDLQTMVKAAIIVTARTQLLDPLLDVLICLLGDNPVETLFGRSRMCGGHAPNCSISELLTRFASAMNLDNVFRHHPELERSPRRLKLVRGRDNDHVGPTQWKGEIAAGSCDIELCYNLGIDVAEGILRKHSVAEPKSFRDYWRKHPDRDLQRPFGGKYPALSSEIDRSMVNTSPSDASDTDSSVNPVFEYNFRWGQTWHREDAGSEPVSSSSHFQLGDLFATFVCYNGTHLGLALAKTTLIKRGPPGGKSPSVLAIPIAELTLPASPFTICGQIFSLLPLKKDRSEWVWDGKFVSLSVKKKGKSGADDINVSRLRNLQLSVSSRLIEPITQNDRRDVFISELESADAENLIDFNSERAKTWVFSQEFILAAWYRLKERIEKDSTLHDKLPVFTGVSDGTFPYQAVQTQIYEGVTYAFSIVDTPIFDAIANRQACRVCGKIVKDTDIQNHMGKHIRKALRNVREEFIKCPIRVKSGKLDSDCSSTYPFRVSSALVFRDTRPCTNIPLQCPLHCEEMHWKYNFPRHLEERHPSWRSLTSPTFIQQITVTRAEELALGIPEAQAISWPPLEPPSSPVCGQKRVNPLSPRSPRRLQCKDSNQNGNKVPRSFLTIPGPNSARRASAVGDGDDVFIHPPPDFFLAPARLLPGDAMRRAANAPFDGGCHSRVRLPARRRTTTHHPPPATQNTSTTAAPRTRPLRLALRGSFIERFTCDKEPIIHAQAVAALAHLFGSEDPSKLQHGERSILDVPLEVLTSDPAAYVLRALPNAWALTHCSDGRRAMLLHILLSTTTLPALFDRARDTNALMRKLVYASPGFQQNLCHLSIAQREQLARASLGDRKPAVRLATGKILLAWLDLVHEADTGELDRLLAFLALFDAVEPGEAVSIDALRSITAARPRSSTCSFFTDTYWSDLTPKSAVLAHTFVENATDVHEEHLERAALPVVTAFTFHIHEAYNRLLTVLDAVEVAAELDGDEVGEEQAQCEVILGECARLRVDTGN